jgi:hypothetical protein
MASKGDSKWYYESMEEYEGTAKIWNDTGECELDIRVCCDELHNILLLVHPVLFFASEQSSERYSFLHYSTHIVEVLFYTIYTFLVFRAQSSIFSSGISSIKITGDKASSVKNSNATYVFLQ